MAIDWRAAAYQSLLLLTRKARMQLRWPEFLDSDCNWTGEWLTNALVPRRRRRRQFSQFVDDICNLFRAGSWWCLIVRSPAVTCEYASRNELSKLERSTAAREVRRDLWHSATRSRLITVPVSGRNLPCHRFHYCNGLDRADIRKAVSVCKGLIYPIDKPLRGQLYRRYRPERDFT